MQRGPHHARSGVDAEDRTDVRRSRSGRQKGFEFVRREPQREDDPLTGGLPAHLPVVEAVQPLLSVAVLETEREPLRSVVPREMERRERILRTPRRIPPPLVAGQRMKRRSARVARYLAVMGKRGYIAVDELCAVTGKSRKKVESDLDFMVEKGLLGAGAYLDSGRGVFFRNANAFADYANETAKKANVTPKEANEGYAGALRAIRSANDRIADPVLSQKIDRLEEVAGKIFRIIEKEPAKKAKASTFLNYYLPTTQKLLDSYAEFEEAGVSGENLNQAKAKIQSTMDSIVAGFERQLDELYRADAMDIDSDIRVMFSLKKNHRLDLMAGHEMVSNYRNQMIASSKYYPMDFTASEVLAMWNYGESQPTYTTLGEPSRTASYFGRLNYAFKDRYMFTFTARADGTNVFAPENRWGFFPGMALAWRISQEKFMKQTEDWLDNLKLRVSYGSVGNARVNSYWRQDYKMESSANRQYYLNETVQSALKLQNTLRNENLTWETKLSSNVGIDASLFNSRLNVTVDFYNDITKDLILRMDLPSNSGYEYQYQNEGRSTNRGGELTLSGTIINSKDFYLGANFNISFNKNIVNKLDGTATVLSAQSNWRPDIGSDDFRAIVGQAVGQIYGFEVEGFYSVDDFTFDENTKKWILNEGVVDDRALFSNDLPNFGPGFIKLKDQNNDGVIDADNDRKVIGSVQPKHIGGFGLNAAWRGFDFAAMFNWSYGNKVYNANKIMASTHTNRKYNNIRDFMSLENRWSIIDPETGANVMYGNDANPERFVEINSKASIWMPMMGRTLVTDWAIEDGSFLRCSNLTLGYTLPVTVTRKLGVKNLRVYATANNLFCWTAYSGQDPEVSTQRSTPLTPGVDYSAYPKAHSYVFGLNVTF